MKYNIDHIKELLIEKIAGTISDEDNLLLQRALENDQSVQRLWRALSDQVESTGGADFLNQLDEKSAWFNVTNNLSEAAPLELSATTEAIKRFNLKRIAAAAVLVLVGISAYFWFPTMDMHVNFISATRDSTIHRATETNKVVLTLSSGESIVLDSAEHGVLLKKGNIEVRKTDDGQLIYEVTQQATDWDHGGVNTITTPPGGQYQIMLPDDSKVWLNAASSLKFPSAFSGDVRTVELNGEAYFEVAKNKQMPFIVKSKWGEIEVLGTGFNVMAYDDENAMKTTLLEGAVNIMGKRILKPGEQAVSDGQKVRVSEVDVSEVVAWRANLFQFNDTPIDAIMREAARWYNVDVVYNGSIPDRAFTGKISRSVGINEFLEMLGYAGINFKVEGNRIIVM